MLSIRFGARKIVGRKKWKEKNIRDLDIVLLWGGVKKTKLVGLRWEYLMAWRNFFVYAKRVLLDNARRAYYLPCLEEKKSGYDSSTIYVCALCTVYTHHNTRNNLLNAFKQRYSEFYSRKLNHLRVFVIIL